MSKFVREWPRRSIEVRFPLFGASDAGGCMKRRPGNVLNNQLPGFVLGVVGELGLEVIAGPLLIGGIGQGVLKSHSGSMHRHGPQLNQEGVNEAWR